MRVTEPKWECYFAGNGPSRCVHSQWRLLATEPTYHISSNSSVRTTCPLSPKTPRAFADQAPLRCEEYLRIFFSQCSQQCRLSTTSVVEQGVWHSPSSANWICKSWTRCGAAAHYPSERFKSHFPNLVAQPTRPYKPLFIAWKPRRPRTSSQEDK
jgi:hypothetical protein